VANRSYLYTSEHLPGSPESEKDRDLHSIAEWNYDIPLVFKLLLTGNPIAVESSIWEVSEKIAVAGDFESGLNALETYLKRLPSEAEPLIKEAREFLSKTSNQRRYFILECGEIFEMEEYSLEESNQILLEEIRELGNQITKIDVPKAIRVEPPKQSFFGKLFGIKPEQPKLDPLEPFYDIGLGNWSNILYFQFGDE
jgi:hypothetical protein